ncbi:hypothetical protein Lser_V15G39236 [Lactuca serriola]
MAVTVSEKTFEAFEEADETIEDQMQSMFLLLRLYLVPSSSWNFCQKQEVNRTSQSETMETGTQWKATISRTYTLANFINENVDGEVDHLERLTTSSSNVPKNLPTEGDMSLNAGPEYRESKQETSSSSSSSSSLPTPSHQYPAVHTSPNPNFSFGFMPPMIGSQVASFENTESQACDASRSATV